MKVAIVGVGNIGARLATNLVRGGQPVIIASRTSEKSQAFADRLGADATAMTVDAAMDASDVIILAMSLDDIEQTIADHKSALTGKIVVDPSNPIASDGKGGFKKTIPADRSSGQLISALLAEAAEVVKAFGTLSAESLESGANRSPDRAVLFYATDSVRAGKAVASLIEASGFAPVSVGGIDQSAKIEVGGKLHEFGKLGRLVTVQEAEAAL